MDVGHLIQMANSVHKDGIVIITFISHEYLGVGLNWICSIKRLGLTNIIVICGDSETTKILKDDGIQCVEARINSCKLNADYRSPVGFTNKGLAMTALKFPIASALVKEGFSVVLSDADAVWLQDPTHHLEADIAFQRVAYFPDTIARLWGFVACSGFVFFRHSADIIGFLQDCIREQLLIQSDQLALNLALLQADTFWTNPPSSFTTYSPDQDQHTSELLANFQEVARFPIRGLIGQYKLEVLALPHNQFWRHSWVAATHSEMVLCHPNSPKNDSGKIEVFKKLGICFEQYDADPQNAHHV